MYLPEGVAILICSRVNMNVLSIGGGKCVVLVNTATHAFAGGGGKFDVSAKGRI